MVINGSQTASFPIRKSEDPPSKGLYLSCFELISLFNCVLIYFLTFPGIYTKKKDSAVSIRTKKNNS